MSLIKRWHTQNNSPRTQTTNQTFTRTTERSSKMRHTSPSPQQHTPKGTRLLLGRQTLRLAVQAFQSLLVPMAVSLNNSSSSHDTLVDPMLSIVSAQLIPPFSFCGNLKHVFSHSKTVERCLAMSAKHTSTASAHWPAAQWRVGSTLRRRSVDSETVSQVSGRNRATPAHLSDLQQLPSCLVTLPLTSND